MELFDCNCGFGPYRTRVFRAASTAADLVEQMDFCGIGQALVYHTAQRFYQAALGNERLLTEIDGNPRLMPTLAILPSQTGEQCDLTTLLGQMKANRVRALRLFPEDHRYFLDDVTWQDQMEVFAERRIPLLIKAGLDKIATLLRAFPDLVVITGTAGGQPLDRYAWPLIERYPSLHMDISGYYIDGSIEELCRRYGAGRLIFGSGFPDHAAGAALLSLAQADISEEDRRLISSDNLSRLLAEASLE